MGLAYNRVFDFATNSVSFRKNEFPAKYQQVEGVRGSKRMRVRSPLMPLFPVSRRGEKQGRKITESSGREIEKRHRRERDIGKKHRELFPPRLALPVPHLYTVYTATINRIAVLALGFAASSNSP